jgi:serine/threonine protein kinase
MNRYKYLYKKLYDHTYFSKLYKFDNKMIKKIPKQQHSSKYQYNYKNEYNILKKIKESSIIKINETYEDRDYFYSVMDFYERGDLYYNIRQKRLNIKDYKKIIKKLVEPIYIIHKQNIVHMDIKLENYVLGNDYDNFILIDFNLSQNHTSNYYEPEKIQTVIGTEPFIAPEIYKKYYCKSSDMYSLGCMLYLIYTNMVYRGDLNLLQNQPEELQNLIKELLNENYKLRPSVYDIKNFLKKG